MKKHCLVLLLLLSGFGAFAQTTDNYPVQVSPLLMPPYTLNWFEFTTNSSLLKVNLLLKDLTKGSLTVYLNIRLSAVGTEIFNPPDFVPNTRFTLSAGQITQLTAADLVENFNAQNLRVQGIDPAILTAGGKLPEGLYTLTVTAYEIDRNRLVSNVGQALMSVYLGMPPLITYPTDGQLIKAPPTAVFQPIMFNWIPRNNASLNSNGNTFYKVTLVQLTDDQDPNIAIEANQVPVYETLSGQTSFLYGAASNGAPALQVGNRYALRVQALDQEGKDVYVNNGYSQVVSFEYGGQCTPPLLTKIQWFEDGPTAVLNWNPTAAATSYELTYQGDKDLKETVVSTGATGLVLNNLDPEQRYRFSIVAVCEAGRRSGSVSTSLAPKEKKNTEIITKPATPASLLNTPVKVDANGNPVVPLSIGEIMEKLDREAVIPKCSNEPLGVVDCDVPQKAAPTPTGRPQTNLQVGDMVVIGESKAIITEIVKRNGNLYAGKAMVKWEFLKSYFATRFDEIEVFEAANSPRGGCVGNGEMVVAGSNNSVLDQDAAALTQQLLNRLTDPKSFSGNLGEALSKVKAKSVEVKQNRDSKQAVYKEDYVELGQYCAAIGGGLTDYIAAKKAEYAKTTVPDDISAVLKDLETLAAQAAQQALCSKEQATASPTKGPNVNLFVCMPDDEIMQSFEQKVTEAEGKLTCKPYKGLMIYGNAETIKQTLTDLGGVQDISSEAVDYKETRIVPAKCTNGTLVGYHVFYTKVLPNKPVLQIGRSDLQEFKDNYDAYTLGVAMYYQNGEPSDGMKKAAAGLLVGSWDLYWEGLKKEWVDCLSDPTCAATIALSTVNGALSQFQSKIPATVFRISWAENQKWTTTTRTTRIGRWMDKIEYDKMVTSQTLQESKNGITHVLLEGPTGFEASAPKGSLYVEFDIPTGVSIVRGSGEGWGLFFSPKNSPHYGFYTSKGLNVVQPSVSNIEIVKIK